MELLHQRYAILEEIGRGGFGSIYKARDTGLGNRLVAIKEMMLLSNTPQDRDEATAAFTHEALILADLLHPNLPRIYEQFQEGSKAYLVMDYIQGESLEQYLQRLRAAHAWLPAPEIFEIARQLCDVLEYLHEHEPPIIFRDLKPSNVMRTASGHLYLIDFGIARHFKPGQAHDTVAFGSPGYAAPEQYGRAQTTPRSDIYSLGALLHYLFSGRDPADTPFLFPPLSLGNPALEGLIASMLELDAEKRPARMADVRDTLQQVAAQDVVNDILPASTFTAWNPPAELIRELVEPFIDEADTQDTHAYGAIGSTYLIYQGHSAGCEHAVTALAWSPDGQYIASGDHLGKVHIWEATRGDTLYIYDGHARGESLIASLAWSPDSRLVASCGYDGTAQIWEAATGRQVGAFVGHAAPVHGLAWSHRQPSLLASASSDGTVQVWNRMSGKVYFTGGSKTMDGARMKTVIWSPDGRSIAFGGSDGVVQVWKLSENGNEPRFQEVTLFQGHAPASTIHALSWSADGVLLASAASDRLVQVWQADTGTLAYTFRGYDEPGCWPRTLAWAHRGYWLATGGSGTDKSVRLCNGLDGRVRFQYQGHLAALNAVVWSPDGARIASASNDGTVHIWQARV
ncbi:serine/threonine protein kinase [Thermosporothrix hazakensis]|jgi:WD40 repeat protein|uniref:Serine/threonine protein kinase n=1 Tax=Thermosporothrix hazakensis TaxID=644383 RepID=A0A326U6H6_THEHA|nr:serine/threonine-protein kinase [Thermosporothrix hazakensis]PZW29460.1 serine/threonine protein kinase [Thermosporothrix hazakensis]GCE45824.1 hypothetical protein KTH_06930 [Thermosporothrix hazakensis]